MGDRWVGLTASTSEVILVDVEVSEDGKLVIQADDGIKLIADDPPAAYKLLYHRLVGYLRDHSIRGVAIKGSAVAAQRSATLALLTSAEVRGVTIAAAREAVEHVVILQKATISRTFGERTVDEYVKDNDFWAGKITGPLKKGSREAAFMIVAALGQT